MADNLEDINNQVSALIQENSSAPEISMLHRHEDLMSQIEQSQSMNLPQSPNGSINMLSDKQAESRYGLLTKLPFCGKQTNKLVFSYPEDIA
jgi:hypothetical protein